MTRPIIEIETISKRYRLGTLGARSLRDEAEILWERFRRGTRNRYNGSCREEKATDFWALRDVSFSIMPGEVVGIIGRNGAGKSTLLKILSRITDPTSGDITLRGRVASLLEVGTGFHPELSGRDNVYLNGTILGMKKTEIARKFDEIVAFAEVDKFIDTPVKRYSSGMYVRLAFAVAAHLDPEILIIDEVLAVGDANFQAKCLGRMQELSADRGRTILFVSHNMPTIRKLCAKAVWLKAGKVHASGNAADIVGLYTADSSSRRSENGRFDNNGIEGEIALLRPGTEEEVTEVLFGHDYLLSCKLRASGSISRLNGVLEIVNSDGEVISMICTREEGITHLSLVTPITIHIELNRLRLFPENFSINFHLFDADTGARVVEALHVYHFKVEPAILGSSTLPYISRTTRVRICDIIRVNHNCAALA